MMLPRMAFASFVRRRTSYLSIYQKKVAGGGQFARNQGIIRSKGKYVAFLDDDDAWLPNKTEQQVQLAEQTGSKLVYGGRRLEIVSPNGIAFEDSVPDESMQGDLSRKILMGFATTTSNILVDREMIVEAGMFDEHLRFWQEYELSIRLAQRTPFLFVPEPVIIYRQDTRDANRLTNKYYEWCESVRYIYQKHRNLYSRLTFHERMMVRQMRWWDAYGRCQNCGLKWHGLGYRALLLVCKLERGRAKLVRRLMGKKKRISDKTKIKT